MNLDSTTGAITLTSTVTGVTEDTVLELTAMAQDHGEPPLNATGQSGGSRRFWRQKERACHNVLLERLQDVLTVW